MLEPATALELWPVLEAHIARAVHYHPFLTVEDFRLLVAADRSCVFLVTRAAAVLGFAACEVVQYPGRRVVNIMLAGGVHGFLGPLTTVLMDRIEVWAAERGATSLSMTGRPGWLRLARTFGWKHQRQVLAHKELTDVGRRRIHNPDGQDQ